MDCKNLLSFTQTEALQFLNSFDTLVADCDGVLWHPIHGQIPGVKEVLRTLQDMGKNVCFVSNNSAKSFESYQKQFQNIGIDLKKDDIIHPAIAATQYLKSIKFNKKIYCIGTRHLVNVLTEAGFQCVVGPDTCVENFVWLFDQCQDEEEIEAVFVDFDVSFNYVKICKAIQILKRPDVIYLVGANDAKLPIVPGDLFLGPGPFQKIITEFSGRNPIGMGKPSEYLKAMAMQQFNIINPERTIFVGDMLDQDMAFGSVCGFQKLLVLTGGTSLKCLDSITDENTLPDYYIESLGHLEKVIDIANTIPKLQTS